MTKRDLIWVLIRGSGLVLIVMALFYAKDIVAGLLVYSYGAAQGSEIAKLWAESVHAGLTQAVISTVFCLIVGVYFLRRGAWIFDLLNHVTPERSNTTPHADARDVPASTSGSAARAGGRER